MKIKSVDIWNMHSIKNKHVELADKNILVGKNGSGKSTVLNAIQLALLGYIPGTNKQNRDIFNHACASPMKVMVTFDNGYYICRTYTKQKSTVKCDVDTFPTELDIKAIVSGLELPIFNFNEFVALSPNMLKDRLMELIPRQNFDLSIKDAIADEMDKLSEETKRLMTTELASIKTDTDILSEIKKLHKYTKDIVSFKQSEVTRLTNSIESSVQYTDVDSSYNLKDVQAKIDYYKKLRADSAEVYRCNETIQAIEAQLADFSLKAPKEDKFHDDRYNEWSFELTCYSNKRDVLKNDLSRETEKIAELKYKKRNLEQSLNASNICPILHDVCDRLTIDRGELAAQLDTVETELLAAQYRYADITSTVNDLTSKIDKLSKNLDGLATNYDVKQQLIDHKAAIKSQVRDMVASTSLNAEFIESELDKLDNIRIKLLANMEYNRIMSKVVKDKYQAELDLAVLKRIADKLGPNQLQAVVSAAPFESAKQIISDNLKACGLPGDAYFVTDGGNNSFDFGLVRDDLHISYKSLSSGEKCLYMLAFMTALLSMNECSINLLLLDDVFDHLDNQHTQLALSYISNDTNVQYIFAGVNNVFVEQKFDNIDVVNM